MTEVSSDAGTSAGLRRLRRSLADQVSDLIAQEFIFNGAVPPGQLLPSEKELAARYETSRITIRQSLRSLREAGLISVRHGIGSTVLARSNVVNYGLDRLVSLDTFAREAGGKAATEDVAFEEIAADEDLSEALEIDQGHRVLRVERVRAFDHTRVAWLVDFIPEGTLPFELIEAEFSGSVLDLLLRHEAVGVDHADLEIKAGALTKDIAACLRVKTGTPAMYMDERVFNHRGRVIERGIGWHLQQYRRFVLRRRRQIGA
jgi:GntR family transcriptional regulator